MWLNYLKIIGLMLKRDLLTLKKSWRDILINMVIWVIVTVFIKIYILPYFGISETYGSLVLVSAISSAANLEIMFRMEFFAQDINEHREQINYDLLLPMPSGLVFVQRALYFAITGLLVSSIVLPVGKLLFWSRVDLSHMSLIRLVPFLLIFNLAYGFFGLYLSSKVSGLQGIINLWMRVLFPLWFLGGFEFSWFALKKMTPNFAYFDLLNPYIYTTEGLRSAVFVPAEYISFWICVPVLILFTIAIGWRGICNLKRNLDTV